MENNLIKIEKFFNSNLKIKELLYNLAPNKEDGFNNYTISQYIDRFLKTLDEIKYILLNILDGFEYGKDVKKVVEMNFNKYETRILGHINGFEDIKQIYQDCCSNMSVDLINKVKKEFVGYLIFSGTVDAIIDQCQTINEILHVIHSSVVNNENYYKSMPKINEKLNYEGYPITLYGRKNNLTQNIFNDFPVEMSCGDTDILSLENNILMMVRDKGHALTIQIEIDTNNTIWVKYFIPKICNVAMVNTLKGVNKVDKNSSFTTGSFATTKENLSIDIIDFINGVPTDKDMVFDYLNKRPIEKEELEEPLIVSKEGNNKKRK